MAADENAPRCSHDVSPDARALASEWDERYTALAARIPDGEPSGALLSMVGDLVPGRALDIGCGISADAIWLADRGWAVTALDVSQVALDRAAARSPHAGVDVDWVCSRLEDAALPAEGFDLVTAHYPALRRSAGHDDVVDLLDDGWDVRIQRRRPLDEPAGLDGQHTHDDVVCATQAGLRFGPAPPR